MLKKQKVPKPPKQPKKLKTKKPFKSAKIKERIFIVVIGLFMFASLFSLLRTNSLQKQMAVLQTEAEVKQTQQNFRPDTQAFGEGFINVYYAYNNQAEDFQNQRNTQLKKYTNLSLGTSSIAIGGLQQVTVSSVMLQQVKAVDASTDEMTYTIRRQATYTDKTQKSFVNAVSFRITNTSGMMSVVTTPRYVSVVNTDPNATTQDPKTLPGKAVASEEQTKLATFINTYMKAYTANNLIDTNYQVLKTMQVEGLIDPGFVASVEDVKIDTATITDDGEYHAIAVIKFKDDVQTSEMKYEFDIIKTGKTYLVKNKL